jgi:hypothetical protein
MWNSGWIAAACLAGLGAREKGRRQPCGLPPEDAACDCGAERQGSLMDVAADVADKGYALVSDVIDRAGLTRLIGAIERAGETEAVRSRSGVYAIRNLLDAVPEVGELARSGAIRALVEPVLGSAAMAVRGILFDKTPEANWKVAWHQDLTIAVRERIDLPDFGRWSTKAGILHVQPPSGILERMLAVRIHLDDCPADNGPVR